MKNTNSPLATPRRKVLAGAIASALVCSAMPASALEVTGSFTGWWGQPQQENHGLIVNISRRADGSKHAAMYWAHYDDAGNPSWLIAIGPIQGDTIQADLRRFDGVTFMQPDDPNTARGETVGTMRVTFDSCASGEVAFDSPLVGSGAFPIERITRQPGTRCSGGISDDRDPEAPVEEIRAPLLPTGAIPEASGDAKYESRPDRVEFKVEIEDVPEGDYLLRVGGVERGVISVVATDSGPEGEIEFESPADDDELLLDFDPRGEVLEIIQDGVVVLEGILEAGEGDPGNPGDPGDPEPPIPGPPPFGDADIEVDLVNDGLHPEGSGDAEFEQGQNRVEFEVEIEDVPVGPYSLWVAGTERGTIEVMEFADGNEGELEFRFPPEPGALPLDFDPRGALVEVFDDTGRAFFVEFPDDGGSDDDEDDGGPGDDDDEDDGGPGNGGPGNGGPGNGGPGDDEDDDGPGDDDDDDEDEDGGPGDDDEDEDGPGDDDDDEDDDGN